MYRRVGGPGTYQLTMALSSSSGVANHISISVGSAAFYVTTARRHRSAKLSVRIKVRGHAVTIRAVGSSLKPQLAVRLRRLADEIPSQLPAASGAPNTGSTNSSASGTTSSVTPKAGSTGATGSTGAGGTTKPTPTPTPTPKPTPTPTPSPPAPPPPPPPPPPAPAFTPVGVPGSWRLIFDDEFSSPSLNTGLWSNGIWGFDGPLASEEEECYPSSQVGLGGGVLSLTAIAKTGSCTVSGGSVTEPYQSGMISTQGKFEFAYGFIEVRAFLPGNGQVADWPGIWAAGNPPLPQGGELDVLEGLSGMACWHYHGPQGDRPGGCAPGTWTGGWHTFAADWEPGKVVWYYDGKVVGTDTQDIASSKEHLILNLAVDQTYGGPIVTPASLQIDYVRVWQH